MTEMTVYVTEPSLARTAHLKIDCPFLANRATWMPPPVEKKAKLSEFVLSKTGSKWVDIEYWSVHKRKIVTRTLRLCFRCGNSHD